MNVRTAPAVNDGGDASGGAVAGAIPLRAEAPFRWVSPGLIRPGAGEPPRRRILLWASEHRPIARVVATQDGREIARRTLPWPVSPGRIFRVPSSLLSRADPRGEPITISLA